MRNTESKKLIEVVEAGRGMAAPVVFVHHIILLYGLQLNEPWNFIAQPFLFGVEAVMVFFVLSGFSIHYSQRHRDLSSLANIGKYFFRRALRIYPVLVWLV